MPNTQIIKDTTVTPEVTPVKEIQSEYKNLLSAEEIEKLSVTTKVIEDRAEKAAFALQDIESKIVLRKKEFKEIVREDPDPLDLYPEDLQEIISEEEIITDDKIALAVKKQLEAINKEKDVIEVQNLILDIEDPYKRQSILNEMKFVSADLPEKKRFEIAQRNASLQLKANTVVPTVLKQQGTTSPASSYINSNIQDDPNTEFLKKEFEKEGLIWTD